VIELSVRRPVAVGVGVILVLLFGALSLLRTPIQLTPDVVKPQITVETTWLGASPHEVEREIVEEQEDELKNVEGLERITSESFDNMGRIVLEFPPGTDLNAALIRVSNRLEQVREYPADAEKPVILTTNRTDNAMAWFMLHRLPGNGRTIDSYFRLADDAVKPRLERVPGVGSANVFGGREEEVHVLVQPEKLAAHGITLAAVLQAIDRENVNTSGGDFTEGKRRYKVRTIGEYQTLEDLERVVLQSEGGRRVYLRDVAEVRLGLKKRDNFVRQRGEPTIAVNSVRSAGANVLVTMGLLREAVREINEGVLAENGLRLLQVYDETEYIDESIRNVVQSLAIGSVLAVAVLYLFLRSAASTFIIAVAIPISIVGSFILMHLLGRTINVISLAGMSFASGMVVDNSIVSLENIFRLRQEGKGRLEAAIQGTREVWGAVLASTLTTIAVFVPIFFTQEKAAQLFRDIAVAIICSVGLSLLVSITVIPAMAARLLASASPRAAPGASRRGASLSLRVIVAGLVASVAGSTWKQVAVVVAFTGLSLGLAWAFLPRAEYLPEGNRNLAIGILLPPPGYSVDELSAMGEVVESRLRPLFRTAEPPRNEVAEAASSAPAPAAAGGSAALDREGAQLSGASEGTEIQNFFYVARENNVFLGAVAADPVRARDLVPTLQNAARDIPGLISVVQQASLFERGIASGRRVDIEVSGPELEVLIGLGGRIFGEVLARFPPHRGHQARPIPSLDLESPELHVVPDRERAKDLGFDAQELGVTVDAIVDGAKASEFMLAGREVDLVVLGSERSGDWRTEEVAEVPVFTPQGKLVSLGTVSQVTVTRGPQQINRIERSRAITIQLVPSAEVAIEEAVDVVRRDIVEPLRTAGAIPRSYDVRIAGTADDLANALGTFRFNFLLAVVITYLLMAALFESYLYPFVILFSVPLAGVGGLLTLNLVHAFVPSVRLDILTMLGFVILVGVVVNNAILIVYRTLEGERDGLGRREALVDAVRTRIRPIFMTTLTSVCGMLPLVLFPGAGSELYRGLGAVVLGGLLVSTVFTLVLVPAVLCLVLNLKERLWGRFVSRGTPEEAS
jgi:HAE1 family hydrophobic/amphiphilic exporter-1